MVPHTLESVNQNSPQLDAPPTDEPVVKVLAITHKQARSASLKALADVQYAGMVITGLMVIAEPKQNAWVAWPSCRDQYGGYSHIVRPIEMDCKRAIEDAILDAWLGVKS
jgi:DNA-binding cell septation regulator SpoVG